MSDEPKPINGRYRYSCHNREPYRTKVLVQDGWTPDGRQNNVLVVDEMTKECQYAKRYAATDMYCDGCKHIPKDEPADTAVVYNVLSRQLEAVPANPYDPGTATIIYDDGSREDITLGAAITGVAATYVILDDEWPEDTDEYRSRIATIGQNGNDGLHYEEEKK